MADAMPGSNAPSTNRNVMILLSYLWLLALIPLVVERDDAEVQWHAKHGLVLAGAELIFWIAYQMITIVLGSFFWVIAWLLAPVIAFGFLILHVAAIIKGINGERLIVPHVSEYANRF